MSGFQIQEREAVKAGIVSPNVYGEKRQLSPQARLSEAEGLARSIKLDIAFSESVNIKDIRAGSYFGEGYIDKLRTQIEEQGIELIIVDASLSPLQQRNLEKKLNTKVIDRRALILEIFGERAQTKEGKLQVELAHLSYQRSRLVRSWTHLERQRGGAGFLGGPGERQIELDRRIIDEKIIRIQKELEKVKQTRSLQRRSRKKIPYPVVALVGYTNAGKSSIFNFLTGAAVLAENQLFATLDPTMRRLQLSSGKEVILSDTVGFISDLPHELIMAFRATLEEVLEADIIVHVRDASNPDSDSQKQDVLGVLSNLGLPHIEEASNYIELFNKIDLLDEDDVQRIVEMSRRKSNIMPFSAVSGFGKDALLHQIMQILSAADQSIKVKVHASDGKIISWLHKNTQVSEISNHGEQMIISCKISPENLSRLHNLPNIIISKNKS